MGVKKHMTPATIRLKFPDVRLVHVFTINEKYVVRDLCKLTLYGYHRVSYRPYRNASKAIFQVISRIPGIIERVGMDECFIDLPESIGIDTGGCLCDSPLTGPSRAGIVQLPTTHGV